MDIATISSHIPALCNSTRVCARNSHKPQSPKFVRLQRDASKSHGLCRTGMRCLNAGNEGSERERPVVEGKDAVIIVDHGSRRRESNLMLLEFVEMFKGRTEYGIVEPAHMELAEPSIGDAFRRCVQQGASRVVVSPFFLFPGRHWYQDIPALAADAAKEHSGVSYIVTAPLGLHELLVNVMDDRIKHCLNHVAGEEGECNVCAGSGRCRLY